MKEYYITPEEFEIANTNGISKVRAYNRKYREGWNKKDAITKPLQRRILNKTHFEIAKNNGICKETVKTRVHQFNWEIEKAITTPVIKRVNEYLNIARSNGISEHTYRNRLRNGWSKERACTTPPMSRKESISKALYTKHGRVITVD